MPSISLSQLAQKELYSSFFIAIPVDEVLSAYKSFLLSCVPMQHEDQEITTAQPTGQLIGGLLFFAYDVLTLQFFLRNGNIHHPQRNHPPIFFA